jgi:precorrin-3B synthase
MNAPLRRGVCPGLSAPMQTGDGFLVRLLPIGTIPLGAFKKLCAAARTFGNGIVEITARGSIQVRGLDAASAPRFAVAVGALGIAAQDGVAVHCNPLSGLDPAEILDAGTLAADLRRVLANNKLAGRLSPKVSVTIDGDGALNLDGLSSDIRLRAEAKDDAPLLRISVGGDAASATDLGFIAPGHAVTAAMALLEMIAQHGCDARARDIVASEGSASFKAAIASLSLGLDQSSTSYGDAKDVDGRDKPGHDGTGGGCEIIGVHRLRDGTFAFGLGLAFGHADARSLESLTEAAAAQGAFGLRAAPHRTLLCIGLSRDALSAFAAQAERLGFIVRNDDPRRHVIACAGAPVCASAHLAVRALAPRVAADNAESLSGSFTIHLSGCAKGCARATPASLTIVGTSGGCALIANGTTRDRPFENVGKEDAAAAIARRVRELTGRAAHV